ncbi:DUF7544 domain-containing protein [Haloterrigena salifodinae]|uniref:DUF7544 domain-containing protein n=1 Tax=Haloterrigena salifodinae TaxID=2675099 RepID=UPI000F87FD36|nr:hypothetical protein [Haloterrigena salifodinae]
MTWSAIDELRPALEATRGLLLPFDLRRWLSLAVIAFFVSGASGGNPGVSTTAGDTPRDESPVAEPPPPIADLVALPEIDLGWIVLAIGIAVAIGLVLLFLGAIMEFVFVRVVTDRDVRLRTHTREQVSNGASLLLFRIALALGIAILIAVPAVVSFLLLSPLFFGLLAVLFAPILIAVGIGIWLVHRFTADFVVPVMLLEDRGVLEAWRAFWPALQEGWKQYVVYAIVRLGLGVVAGFVAGIGFVAIGLVLAVPFGIVAVVLYLVFETALGLLSIAVLAVIAVLYALSVLVAGVTLVQVPIQTYLRYYSLFVLGSITPPFDAVRSLRSTETDRTDAG